MGHYKDCKDAGSYLCGDEIVDIVAVRSDQHATRLTVVLACSGRALRVLEHCRVLSTVEASAVPTALQVIPNTPAVLCGMADGGVSWLNLDGRASLRPFVESGGAPIACLDVVADQEGGVASSWQLLVARLDGTVQIYSCTSPTGLYAELPELVYYTNINEGVSSLRGGIVGQSGKSELLACTFSGRVIGLTTTSPTNSRGPSGDISGLQYNDKRTDKLRSEILELEQKVSRERTRYQASTQASSQGSSSIPALDLRDMLVLSRENASYSLSLEAPTALDFVLVRSDVLVDLLDSPDATAVVSKSECEPGSGNCLLATYRCQLNTNRLEIRFRTVERQHGHLTVHVTPLLQPKCCQVRSYLIRPLSLHARTHTPPDPNRPYNHLRLSGPFSLAEMHSWLSYCIPEFPERPETKGGGDDRACYSFVSTFIGTVVNCEYGRGEAEIKSDNVSTISVLKDVLTKEATKKNIRLDITCSINEDSIPHTLTLMDEILQTQRELARNIILLDALDELDIRHEDDVLALSAEFRDVIQRESEIREQAKQKPALLDRLYGNITDLYVDRYKFKGVNVRNSISSLLQVLDKYDLKALIEFFDTQKNAESA